MRQLLFFFSLFFPTLYAFADTLEQESIKAIQYQQQQEKKQDVGLDLFSPLPIFHQPDFPILESPCFPIRKISLHSSLDHHFSFLISQLYKQLSISAEICVGEKNLQIIQQYAQNILIKNGFITSYVYFDHQDLMSKTLFLSIQSGYLNNIIFKDQLHQLTQLGQYSAFPIQEGKRLNLFELEQGLENLKRLNYTEVSIDIVPSSRENYSDVIVNRKQSKQFELGIGINSFGGKNTGKYQSEVDLNIYSLFGLNDLFYVQYHQDIGHHKIKLTDQFNNKTESGTKGYYLHYSLPMGFWLWQINYSLNGYSDATEGMYRNYLYRGKTYRFNTLLNRTVFRNNRQKINMSGKVWHTKIQKFLDKEEILVQRRKISGWEIGLSHLQQVSDYHIEGKINYKRGIGFKSLPAPEEINNEGDIISGKSRMKIINAELNIQRSFSLFKQNLSSTHHLYAQWNKTPLIPQDKLNIGNYYTVRGFDGEHSLQGERGWYSQNNLNWHYKQNHQLYIGFDYGYVSGITGKLQNKQKISGTILGITGNISDLNRKLNYHLFIARPINQHNQPLFGFSSHYHF